MSHVENSRIVEFSFGAESLLKLFNNIVEGATPTTLGTLME